MAINPLGAIGPTRISGAGGVSHAGEDFGKMMKGQLSPSLRTENTPQSVTNAPITEAKASANAHKGISRVEGAHGASSSHQVTATKVLDHMNQAQNRMEQILQLAESGKSFSAAELLSLQTRVYRASQELDLAGKVVEKATGGVKQVLQTQV